ALAGAFFWGVWGDGRSKASPVAALRVPEPIPTPTAAPEPALASVARPQTVIKVLADIVQPANRKSRVEIADLLAAYVAESKSRGCAAAGVEAFGAQAKAFADAAGIRVLSSAGKLYWCGVSLGSVARKGETA